MKAPIFMADSRKKLIFPLVIAPMEIPPEMEYSLSGLQQIDFVTDPDAGDRQLLSALKSLHAIELPSGSNVRARPSVQRQRGSVYA
jgi:hypothetical protein